MKVAGFALLAAGLAFVFHAYSPSKFNHATPIQAHESQPIPGQPSVKLTRNFSIDPAITLMSVADRADARMERAAPEPQQLAALPVAVEVPRTEMAEAPPAPSPLFAASDDSNNSRASVVRRIKRELRRVGCYDGRIDSEWDRSSRAAMATFVDRVNASLPSQEPDVVLLNLVRNHKAAACGATCPLGQAMDGDGRCLPDAIIAKMKRKANPAVAHNAPAMKPFTTTVTINEVRPTAATLPPPPMAPQVQIATKAPLPGRMAMGGPVGGSKASVAPPEKSWWDNFIGGVSQTQDATAQQTLDRPVGLTHVPQPRLVRRTPQTGETAQQQANLVTASTEVGSAGDGTGDGTALLATAPSVEPTALATVPKARPTRSYRKAARSKGRQKYGRRWGGRNVQAMFQHPLGR